MRTRTRRAETFPLLAILLLSAAIVFTRLPAIQAQDSTSVFSENFENGWGSWIDVYTGLTPAYSLSTNESLSATHSAWGAYTPNKLLISKNSSATSQDVRIEAWLYLKSGGYNVEAGFKLYYNSTLLAAFLASDYNSPTYEVDKWTGYDWTVPKDSFYDSWTNVTMLLHFSNDTVKVWINNSLMFDLNNSNSPYSSINEIRLFSDDGDAGAYIDDVSVSQAEGVSPTPTPSPTATPTTTPTPTSNPTSTPTPTPPPNPTPTAMPTSNPTDSPTSIPMLDPSPLPTAIPTSTPSVSASPTPVQTETSEAFSPEAIFAMAVVAIAVVAATAAIIIKRKRK